MPLPLIVVVGASAMAGAASVLAWLGFRKPTKDGDEKESGNKEEGGDEKVVKSQEPKPIPKDVILAVAHLRQHHAAADEIVAAAEKAELAGHAQLALALRNEAAVLAAAEKFSEETANEVISDAVRFMSPLENVSEEQWTKFVKKSRTHRTNSVSDNYRLGAYQFSARDLADAGYMTAAQKVEEEGHAVWVGEWADGRSLEDFLKSPTQQYEALVGLTKLHAGVVAKKHQKVIGSTIENQTVTLSGLLGVARKAGIGGLASWIKSAKERSVFRDTTERYEKLNGIF